MSPVAFARNSLPILVSFMILFAVIHFTQSSRSFPGVTDVSVPEAVALIDSGALVIDARGRAASGAAHLPGALLIPVEVLAARLSELEYAKTQSIVVYCGNGTTRGPEAAHILTQAGFTRVVNLGPGIEGWRAAGLPVAAS
jgi:rhodanese-related sulfurtransferase